MNSFRSSNPSRDRRDFSRRDFGDRDSRRPQLYEAVCAECGKTCQVPFRPSGERPVYCSECFEKKGGKDSNQSRERRDSSRRSYEDRDSRRPSFQGETDNRGISPLVEGISALSTKLDKIIDLLSPAEKKPSKPAENKIEKTKKSPIKEESKIAKKSTSTKKKAAPKTEDKS